jgi:hypothetical protein
MRNESASIVMIAGANCDRNEVRQLSNERSDFTRLFQPGFGLEHVEQITGNADKVEVWSLFDQPPKPKKAELKVGCQKEPHGPGKVVHVGGRVHWRRTHAPTPFWREKQDTALTMIHKDRRPYTGPVGQHSVARWQIKRADRRRY